MLGSHHPAAQVPGSCLGCVIGVERISLTIQPVFAHYMRAFGLKVQLNDFNVFLVDCNKFPSGPFRIRQILELPEGDKIPSFQGPPKTIQSAATLGQSKCLTVVAVPTY